MDTQPFGHVAANDWPLKTPAKAKIYGFAGEYYRMQHLKPAIFKTTDAATSALKRLYKQFYNQFNEIQRTILMQLHVKGELTVSTKYTDHILSLAAQGLIKQELINESFKVTKS